MQGHFISCHPRSHFSKFKNTHKLIVNLKAYPEVKNEKDPQLPWE